MGEDLLSASLADDCEPDYCDPIQRLGLIEKLESYADAEQVYTRQLTARGVVRALQFVEEYAETQRLLAIIIKISDDTDVTVRVDLLENISQIAHFCHVNAKLFENDADPPISSFIVPFILQYLKESHSQIRKASQAALLYLLEHRILSQEETVVNLVPVVVNFAQCQTSDDMRADAANLMCKMAPVLGGELTEKLVLEPFLQLCTDAAFHVRKVCAVNIGDLCCILGQQRTEERVLGKFYALCEDSIWGVRKACCECFAQVSSVCSPTVRRTDLSQLFINLIYDQSRWVRMAAFEVLGSFIATFADPSVTGLYLTDDGVLDFRPTNGLSEINLKILDTSEPPVTKRETDDVNSNSSLSCVTLNSTETDLQPETSETATNSINDGLVETPSNDTSSVDASCDQLLPVVDHPCESKSSLADVAETAVCSDSAPLVELTEDTNYIQESCLSNANESLDDKNKPSLEMFSSEVDAVGGSLNAVQYGSLELLCENDGEVELNCSPECVASSELHDASQAVTASASADAQTVEKFAGKSSESEELASSPCSSVDTLAKMSMELEIMTVCDHSAKECAADHSSADAGALNETSANLDGSSSELVNGPAGMNEALPAQNVEAGTVQSETCISTQDSVAVPDEDSLATVVESETSLPAENDTSPVHPNVNLSDSPDDYLSLNYPDVVNIEACSLAVSVVTSIAKLDGSGDRFISEEDSSLKGVNLVCLENLDESTESGEDSMDEDDQSVVPRDLLNHYLGMMDPACALTVDNEVTRHCAYSLPAVAFTLGRRNWPALRDLYRALSSDVQWKVRRTLASSMHELAVIVGEEVTVRDLVPVFDQFLGDLDEVRIGVLKHLADFIKLLPDEVRHGYLSKLTELLKLDNSHNWRFREELANQLCLVIDLYHPSEVHTYVCPMAFTLADDKVAAVRQAAVHLLCRILKHLNAAESRAAYINELTSRFGTSAHYGGRQMFIQLCDCVLEDLAIEGRGFTDSFLQLMLALHQDRVPNVRISLARTLARHADRLEHLCRECAIEADLLDGVVNSLKHDSDRDVRQLIEQAKLFSVIC